VAKYAISKSNQLDKRVGSYNSFLWQISEIRALLYKNLENVDIYKMNISIVLMLDCLCLRLWLWHDKICGRLRSYWHLTSSTIICETGL
jgi:hypothetical protein